MNCKIHNKKIHSFCSAEKCENIMLCNSCIINHCKDHEEKMIHESNLNESFIMEKIENIFNTIKNEDDENHKIYESLIEQIDRIEAICVSNFKEIKKEIQNVMGLINFDMRKSITNKIIDSYNVGKEKEDIFSIEQIYKEVFDQINDCETNIKNINQPSYFKFIHFEVMEACTSLQQFIVEKKSIVISKLKEDCPKNVNQENIDVFDSEVDMGGGLFDF